MPRMWDNENICLMKTTPQALPPPFPVSSERLIPYVAWRPSKMLRNSLRKTWHYKTQWRQPLLKTNICCFLITDKITFLNQHFVVRFKNVQPFARLFSAQKRIQAISVYLSLLDASIRTTVNAQSVSQTILGLHYNKPQRALRWL